MFRDFYRATTFSRRSVLSAPFGDKNWQISLSFGNSRNDVQFSVFSQVSTTCSEIEKSGSAKFVNAWNGKFLNTRNGLCFWKVFEFTTVSGRFSIVFSQPIFQIGDGKFFRDHFDLFFPLSYIPDTSASLNDFIPLWICSKLWSSVAQWKQFSTTRT